ncbi:hypothetical protein [Ilumatobacter coccineus]|uniref:Uncharacterized protein n=1 Tax=Ilumatobacter coccineus (strain NBRC 103263 / KCTC 29153 / YM16-304) TaxID=1313172 RepID=A0A6C7E3L2_ILUCY|nr:hypothetical protein [Ilumatobacter coccineus]BAN00902.1 hypothetical protein YM304_05880 [Ilumatobacter coccineus YM16-304]
MRPRNDRRQQHIVVASDDHVQASRVGLSLARRLHRPFLDGTATPEAMLAASDSDAESTPRDAVCAWFHTATRTSCGAVVATPAFVLGRRTDDSGDTDVWVVRLDGDPDDVGDADAHSDTDTGVDVRLAVRHDDVDQVVDRIVTAWNAIDT